ncbi:kinase-like domain-containing protein [Rhizophagus irregularis DAOM 181602=DAOM 197198]|nr:kinase-like domain-containing protein [Rhizophagus irregularis DAOM 181602=DAOM 197198]
MLNILIKEDLNLDENLNEFLKEWEYHISVLTSNDIINVYGFTEDTNTSKYMVVMYYANKDLMKKCWNEDPLKRPSTSEVKGIIKNWIIRPDDKINEELKSNIMEFINAPIVHSDLATKSHPKAYHTSCLLDFTSKKLNEILESENLDNYIINDLKLLDIKAVENTSENLNEILESEDLQASVEVNEQLSEDLNDYIIKDLKSLDEN